MAGSVAINVAGLNDVGAKVAERLTELRLKFELTVAAEAASLADTVSAIERSVTPVGKSGPVNPWFEARDILPTPGKLKASTHTVLQAVPGGWKLTTIQDAKSPAGVEYGNIIRKGRPAIDRRGVAGKALAGPTFGPRRYSKGVAANDYPEKAMPQVEAAVHEAALSVMRRMAASR